jgi:hypothetical protein
MRLSPHLTAPRLKLAMVGKGQRAEDAKPKAELTRVPDHWFPPEGGMGMLHWLNKRVAAGLFSEYR